MNKYSWRNNITATAETIRGKLAFKTKETHWIDTFEPVALLVSIHSAFHAGLPGDLKMQALMATLKRYVKGKITVLFCDMAHLHAMSLEYEGDRFRAFEQIRLKALQLQRRYNPYFESCTLKFWHSYICQDVHYETKRSLVQQLALDDPYFHSLLVHDAGIGNVHDDIIEQCICLLVLAEKGYRFQFYPGKSNASTEYVNRLLLPAEKQISWINVFLTIEKKTLIG